MANVEEARKAVAEFLKRTLDVKEATVIKVAKVSDGWETYAEVYEENLLIKSLGYPCKVQDRNIYAVRLNDGLEVESYEKTEQPVQVQTE